MTTRLKSFKQIDVTRSLKGAAAAGLETTACRINPQSGEIELIFAGDKKNTDNTFDTIMGLD